MNEQKTSERYYVFEDLLWEMPGFAHLRRRQSIADLQLLAGLIWARESGRGKCPAIKARKQNDYSYRLGDAIHLIRAHRCIGGLLHEMAHALGPWDKQLHGPAFHKRCARLYKTYGEWPRD